MGEPESELQTIVFLRGINVGKAKRIAMADLRKLFQNLGCSDVRTVLNSGNVLFRISGTAAGSLNATGIEAAIAKSLNVNTSVIVVTVDELSVVVSENPLLEIAEDPSRLLIAFPSNPRDRHLLEPLLQLDWSPEAISLGYRVAYLWCPDGVLESKLPAAVGKALNDAVTIRNWSTIGKIYRLLE